MTEDLEERIEASLKRELSPQVRALARVLGEEAGALAVLFYGSNLRTGETEGVLDFYVLLPGRQQERIWPRVSYREWTHGSETMRAKIATMSLAQFAKAASGKSRDTTIWTRFVQPSALAWALDDSAKRSVARAIAAAAKTAARFAAALGPPSGSHEDFWRALFRETYRAEFRVEKAGREHSILSVNSEHFEGLLPMAWEADALAFENHDGTLAPQLTARQRSAIRRRWSGLAKLGRPLNILRLAKATTTFEGAAAYAAWKLQRHTGIALEVTPFRRDHPLLAMPGAAWELWRARRTRARN